MIFVFVWLTLLSMIIFRSIHIAANDIISFFIYHIVFIHSSVYGHLGYFHILAISVLEIDLLESKVQDVVF